MCGRYYLKISIDKLLEKYGIIDNDSDNIPVGEIFPSQHAPIILNEQNICLKMAKWGFAPSYAKRLIINARAETIDKKKTFKGPFYNKRCLIPVSGFFEWQDKDGKKIKHRIYLKDQEFFSLAGLYEHSLDSSGNRITEFVIITTEANDIIKKIHDRMPVILSKDNEQIWLNNDTDIKHLKDVLRTYPEEGIILEPVTARLGFDF